MVLLGPFELQDPVAWGGASEVWRGVHRDQGVPVAIKVLTGAHVHDPDFRASFRREVRTVAGLDHPNIVMVFDYGDVPRSVETASHGRLKVRSPWLAMELAEGGTLAQWRGRLAWSVLREVLGVVLDALGHAHARGVTHRDLKPGNVLIGGARGGLKLADFGLADSRVVRARGGEAPVLAGTPSYMAPEQVASGDQGPWTDLYALGCLAFALACGEPPLGYLRDLEEATAHLHRAPRRLRPRHPMPADFETWVRWLLEKNPARRPDCAADAARALEEIAGAMIPAHDPSPTGELEPESSTFTWSRAETPTQPSLPSTQRGRLPTPTVGDGWWKRDPRPISMGMVGVGLRLFGLRALPLVGREEEREVLWSALLSVRREGAARIVSIGGPTGAGKSRLAEWLCERAQEEGIAVAMHAAHGPSGGAADGLGPMVARHLRCDGASPEVVLDRLVGWPEGLVEIVAPSGAVRFSTPAERYAVLQRMLEALCTRRPVVLWLDDVQWGLDALSFCEQLVAVRLPVLILMTSREEALAERPAEAQLLAGLLARPETVRMEVGPLPPSQRHALVQNMLRLEPGLAAKVEERTQGNPLFAVHLVGDWVQRGLLETGDGGFRLRAGVGAELPDGLHEVWSGLVERLVAERPAGDAVALELAAALGQEVVVTEWAEVCRRAEVEASDGLVDALQDRRLARRAQEGAGWSFVHGMLRESVERRAREAGRWRQHHRACADMLGTRAAVTGLSARLGRHLSAAGEGARALGPLTAGVQEAFAGSEFRVAAVLLEEIEGLVRTLAVPEEQRVHGDVAMMRARLAFITGRNDEASVTAFNASVAATRHGWGGIRGESLMLRARAARRREDSLAAVPLLEEAARILEAEGDEAMMGRARLIQGQVLGETGAVAKASAPIEQARDIAAARGDLLQRAYAEYWLAIFASQQGRHAAGLEIMERAFGDLVKHGFRRDAANGHNGMGELLRWNGRLDEAHEHYEAAQKLWLACGAADAVEAQVSEAMVRVARGEWEEARTVLVGCMADARDTGREPGVLVLVSLLVIDAATGPLTDFDRHLDATLDALSRSALVMQDIALHAHRAAELLAPYDPLRARTVADLAATQWRMLGREVEVAAIEALVRGLG